ncbi:hypothetical protein OXX80_003098 [Metschnikowia pulcherrima]
MSSIGNDNYTASALHQICQKYVTATSVGGFQEMNAVIAGYTDRNETRFLSAHGVKNMETKESATIDSMMCYYSCTKSITAMAVLLLWERGQVELDVPAKNYLPLIGECGIVESGQIDSSTGQLRSPPTKPQTDITIRHLLTHTSGFAYIITHPTYYSIMMSKKIFTASKVLFQPENMPLIFEPGTDWIYGHGFDWLGLIVEAVSGQNLSDFLQENIFAKAGMDSCTFQMTNPSSMVHLHDKTEGNVKLWTKPLPIPLTSEIDMGGHGCFGTIGDYLKFMRIWLNYGTSPDTGLQILRRETVELAVENHLSPGQALNFPTPFSDPSDGFSLAGCGRTEKDLDNGRPAGSLFWAGLANLYFWIDLENGCAGIWGSQIMPYMDSGCVAGFKEFEAAVYKDYSPGTGSI